MRKDYLRTLFSRMLATYLIVTVGMLLLSGVTIGALVQAQSLREKKEELSRELTAVSQLYQNRLSGYAVENLTEMELDVVARHYDCMIQIVSADGSVELHSSGAKWNAAAAEQFSPERVSDWIVSLESRGGERFEQTHGKTHLLSAARAFAATDAPAYVVRMTMDISAMQSGGQMLYLEVILASLMATLVAVIAVYYTTTRLTKPFMEINETVQKYSKGDYNLRIPTSSTQEATQLAVSFNAMADQLKDLEATRQSFVANVSHELRSPLTSIKGFLEAMQDGTIGQDDYDKYIDIVLSETRRMAAMVNDLLDLARIESGRTALRLEIFDINELIRRTLITFEARIYEKAMEVEVKFAQEDFFVEADSAQISQVLRNIIDNAIKYSPDSTRLRIATYAMRREVYVSIADSGPGIPEEDIPHVFDRFYKVEKAHTPTKQSGTGLGLSIVKRIIDQHGQTITLKSARGKGSTFTFTLKRAPSPKRAPQQDGGRRNGER